MTDEQMDHLLQSELTKIMRKIRKVRLSLLSDQVIYSEYIALNQIDRYAKEHPDSSGIYVSALAAHMEIAPSAASRMLNSLEGKGLIIREVDAKARRNIYVRLTPEGSQVLEHFSHDIDILRERLVRRMGHEDITQLIELWNRLAGIMEEEVEFVLSGRESAVTTEMADIEETKQKRGEPS